jgi:hypothetical protein
MAAAGLDRFRRSPRSVAFLQAAPVPLTRRGQTLGRYLNCRVRPSCRDDDERLERGLVKRFAGMRDNGRDLWMGQQTKAPGSV